MLSYAYAFLVDGLKLKRDKLITVQREVDESEIEWALGAAYKEIAGAVLVIALIFKIKHF